MSLPKDGGDVGGPAALAPSGGGSARPREGSRNIQKEGKIISVPDDWCHSPIKIVPYAIWAWQSDASNLANTVRQTGDRSHAKHSVVLMCFGDEKGTGGGVISHTHNGACWPKTWSETVRFEGRNAVRHDDEWWMNNRNTWGKLQYTKDMRQYETLQQSTIDAKMSQPLSGADLYEALYQAPGTAATAAPVTETPGAIGGSEAGGSAMSRLGTTLGIGALGYGAGQMAGQYYLGQDGNVAVGITNYQMGQAPPFSPQGQAIGQSLGFPTSASRMDEANNLLSLKAGEPVDFRQMSPDQLDQLVRQPWPSPEQIKKNEEALKTKTKPKPGPVPPPIPPPGVRVSGRCRTETVPFETGSYDKVEYQRQLTMQQNALNAKGACKSYADKDGFDQKSPSQKALDRANATKVQRAYTKQYQATNPNVSTSNLAALHRLDMAAGGDMTDIAGMGDRGVNSSIGPEWTAETRGGKMKKYAKEMCDNGCPMQIILVAT